MPNHTPPPSPSAMRARSLPLSLRKFFLPALKMRYRVAVRLWSRTSRPPTAVGWIRRRLCSTFSGNPRRPSVAEPNATARTHMAKSGGTNPIWSTLKGGCCVDARKGGQHQLFLNAEMSFRSWEEAVAEGVAQLAVVEEAGPVAVVVPEGRLRARVRAAAAGPRVIAAL